MGILQTLFGDDAAVLYERDFQLLLLASLSSPLGASVVSPILEGLTGPLGVSSARAGLLMAVFTAPAIVLIPLVGVLSDRVGRKPVLTGGLLLFGLAGLAVTLTTDFRSVLGLRFLQGVGYTGIAPVLITSVGDIFADDADAEASAQGLRFTAVGVSLTVFPVLSGALVVLAWQYPFYLYGLAVPTALVVWALFEEPTAADAVGPNGADAGHADDADKPVRDGSTRALLSLTTHPRVAATLVGRAVPSFLWFVFLTYNSVVVVRFLGGSAGVAGLLVAAASVASSVSSTQSGRITAAFDTRVVPMFASTTAIGAGVLALVFAPSTLVAGVGVVFAGAGFGLGLTLYRSALTGSAPVELRGGLVSLGESAGRLGSTVAPVLTGAVVAVAAPTLGPVDSVRWGVVGVVAAAVLVGVVSVAVVDRFDAPARSRAGTSTAD
ncbi:Predicted arabinose efflux permease, MFS family [Halogranum gelatinilyticum]|uniref:Predicted arabinose efflux permease, MFS family n=1 Tax=Halogranum gelatinilyticum TaxID=660521 RepID=A0A1G9VLU9_9EURY|nr:MFS transporter [Halogranum gelatinilyticum]SDM73212.1 Predicted arabinose efflux permease, MFS family [Halogranum gelatinilyticum]